MEHRQYDELLKKYVSGEISEKEKARFKKHLETCLQCRSELKEFDQLEAMMNEMKLKDPEDKMWEGYWASIYNRMERGVGWILFSIGAIMLVFYGLFKFAEKLIADPSVALIVKIGIVGLLVGLAILIVSIARQQVFAYRKERYREVKK